MKILSLGLDNTVLDKKSILADKTREYASMTEGYYLLVPYKKDIKIKLSDNLRVYGVGGCCRVVKFLKIYILAKLIIKKYHCNVITTQDPFELGFLGWRLAKKFKIAWNVQEHGDFFSQKYWRQESIFNYLRYFLGKFLIKRADSIRVVSQRIKEYLIAQMRINKEKIISVPVLIEASENFSKKIKSEAVAEDFVFLNLGRFVRQKNLKMILRSFKTVLDKGKKAKLIMIGKGPLEDEIKKEIKSLGIAAQVELKYWVSDMWQEFACADAYVLSSNYEGWGRVIIEAALASVPIIMTDVGCAGEIIKNKKSGLVIPAEDEKEFATAMISIIDDKELRKSLTLAASKSAMSLSDKKTTLGLYKKSWEVAKAQRMVSGK